jgi:hypothetical protein
MIAAWILFWVFWVAWVLTHDVVEHYPATLIAFGLSWLLLALS